MTVQILKRFYPEYLKFWNTNVINWTEKADCLLETGASNIQNGYIFVLWRGKLGSGQGVVIEKKNKKQETLNVI